MEKLNIFTVEKLIFQNPKAKKILWKEFSIFFKEYTFLVKAGIDRALLQRLYINFFKELNKKNAKSYLNKIFPEQEIKFQYNFKPSVINTSCNLNSNYKNKLIECSEINKLYSNFSLTRNKNTISITFWK
ncbi:MAG: hypothetical protein ACOCV1_03660 [Bacillota bacterium]